MLRCVVFFHPRLQPAEEQSWRQSPQSQPCGRKITGSRGGLDRGILDALEGVREGSREGGKREKIREGERKKALTTQGQILKRAALWFRLRP